MTSVRAGLLQRLNLEVSACHTGLSPRASCSDALPDFPFNGSLSLERGLFLQPFFFLMQFSKS